MAGAAYTPEQVTKGLMAVVAHGGNVAAASEELIDDEYQIPAARLREWKTTTHTEQYRQLQDRAARELEDEAVETARGIIKRAGELEQAVLDRLEDKIQSMDGRELALAAKQLSDVKSKNVEKVLQLTGRGGERESGEDFASLLRGLSQLGLVRLNVPLLPPDVNGHALERE